MGDNVPSKPRIWDMVEEDERDIGRQWHRAQLLARIFGRWVGWYIEWQRVQDEVDMLIIEPFQRRKLNKLQRKWFSIGKKTAENKINMVSTVRLAVQFRILYSYQHAIKRLLLYSRKLVPKSSNKNDLTHRLYYYRIFLHKLQRKYEKKWINYHKLKRNMPPDALQTSYLALRDHVMTQKDIRNQNGMLLQHYRRYRMSRLYYKIIHRIKNKLYCRINLGNHVKTLENHKKRLVMSKLYAYSHRQSHIDYKKAIIQHNTQVQRKGLLLLKLVAQKDRETEDVYHFYDEIFRKNQNKAFILQLIRLQRRRLLQCDSEYRTEQYFHCNWKFHRIGHGVDIWRHRYRILQCQGNSMDKSVRHYKFVIKKKALTRWQRYGHQLAKRSLRCRVIAQFHRDMKVMTKYIHQFYERNHEKRAQQQIMVKSIWFWRAFRSIKSLRTWRAFVDTERAARTVKIDSTQLMQATQEGSDLWHGSVLLNGTMKRTAAKAPSPPATIHVVVDDVADKPIEHVNADVIRALARAPPRTLIPDFLESVIPATTDRPKVNENRRIQGDKDVNKLLIARDIIQFVSEMQKELRVRSYTNTINIH